MDDPSPKKKVKKRVRKTKPTSYCCKCKSKVTVNDCTYSVAKNGRRIQRGKCSSCSTSTTSFVKGTQSKVTTKESSDSKNVELVSEEAEPDAE